MAELRSEMRNPVAGGARAEENSGKDQRDDDQSKPSAGMRNAGLRGYLGVGVAGSLRSLQFFRRGRRNRGCEKSAGPMKVDSLRGIGSNLIGFSVDFPNPLPQLFTVVLTLAS